MNSNICLILIYYPIAVAYGSILVADEEQNEAEPIESSSSPSTGI